MIRISFSYPQNAPPGAFFVDETALCPYGGLVANRLMARVEYRAGDPTWVILGKRRRGHVLYVVFSVEAEDGDWVVGRPLRAFHDLASKPVELNSLSKRLLTTLADKAELVLGQARTEEMSHSYREARSGVASLRDEAGRR